MTSKTQHPALGGIGLARGAKQAAGDHTGSFHQTIETAVGSWGHGSGWSRAFDTSRRHEFGSSALMEKPDVATLKSTMTGSGSLKLLGHPVD